MLNYPVLVLIPTVLILWLAARYGMALRQRRPLRDGERDDFGIVQGATLTLLALLIGFTFSMATTRYDLRKNYEEAEANAIGTEYLRVELLPDSEVPHIQTLLREYLEQRILYYETRDGPKLQKIGGRTAELQTQLWSSVRGQAAVSPTPITALVLAGMNDVINSQGYTQAAWWNRIPTEAWVLMGLISVLCNLMLGYMTGKLKARTFLVILPLVVAVAFTLIADIDSPRRGLINVVPQNLQALEATLR